MAVAAPDPVSAYAESVVSGQTVAGRLVRAACQRHLNDLKEGPKRGLKFDAAKAQHFIDFAQFFRLSDGQWKDKPFTLQPSQEFIGGCLFGWIGEDGYRRFRTAYIEAGKGSGKALAIDTPIPTPDGWRTMGDLMPGDKVFDENGQVCNVTAVTDVMYGRECYQVRFSDGECIIADADHLWETTTLRSGRKKGDALRGVKKSDWLSSGRGSRGVRTTAEIAKTLTAGPSNSSYPQAKWNHRVQVAGAIKLPQKQLPVSPYTLGAWLGDGDSNAARLTCAFRDCEVLDRIRADGVSVLERKKHSQTTGRFLLGGGSRAKLARSTSLQAKLRAMGLLNNKHIPEEYFWASEQQRLELLQGLLDTDGSALKDGAIEFTSTKPRLAEGIIQLLRSLGFKPTAKESDAVLRGRVVGRRWRVRFHAYSNQQVFRLRRKQKRLKPPPLTRPLSLGRMIVGCDLIPSVPVKCISVDSPSRLYLAGRGMIPTHNSPLSALVGLYGLIADKEARAEIYAAAQKRDQAMVLFRDAVALVDSSPLLKSKILKSGVNPVWNLTFNGSFFRPISSEDGGQSGPRPHMGLIDELHEHKSAHVVDMIRAGTKARRQALLFEITNSGFDRNTVCWAHREYSERVLQARSPEDAGFDDSWFAYVCTLDPCPKCLREGKTFPDETCPDCDQWTDERCWPKANPTIDVVLPRKYLREQVREALGMPSKQNTVKRLNFCVWTESCEKWLDIEAWDECGGAVDPESLRGRHCFGGLDLARVKDLSALALLFPPMEEGEKWKVLLWFWVPQEDMHTRSKRDRVPYDVWVRSRLIETTPGNTTDFAFIKDKILQLSSVYEILEIAYDRTFAGELINTLTDEGVKMVEFGQGFLSMAAPTAELERLVLSRQLLHGGNPVLRWMASNVTVRHDPAGNIKPDKETSTERIDGICALIMALGRAISGETHLGGPSITFI